MSMNPGARRGWLHSPSPRRKPHPGVPAWPCPLEGGAWSGAELAWGPPVPRPPVCLPPLTCYPAPTCRAVFENPLHVPSVISKEHNLFTAEILPSFRGSVVWERCQGPMRGRGRGEAPPPGTPNLWLFLKQRTSVYINTPFPRHLPLAQQFPVPGCLSHGLLEAHSLIPCPGASHTEGPAPSTGMAVDWLRGHCDLARPPSASPPPSFLCGLWLGAL